MDAQKVEEIATRIYWVENLRALNSARGGKLCGLGAALFLVFVFGDMAFLNLNFACEIRPWEHLAKATYAFAPFGKVAAAYRDNVARANALVLLPGEMFTIGGEWGSCLSRTAQKLFPGRMPGDAELEAWKPRMIQMMQAGRAKTLAAESKESRNARFRTATHNAEYFASEDAASYAILHDVLKGSLAQSWTAFEILAEKLWSEVIRCRPALDTRTGKERHGSGHRSRTKIANLYKFTFRTDNADIIRAIDSPKVHALALARNVLVHAGGRIDTDFAKDRVGIRPLNCIRARKIGYPIQFTGRLVRRLVDPVIPLGFGLLRAVDKWLIRHP